MAKVFVEGKVVSRRDFPARENQEAQVSISIQDGQRFGMFVPPDHEIAQLEEGDIVEISGILELNRKGYLNIREPVLERQAVVTWA